MNAFTALGRRLHRRSVTSSILLVLVSFSLLWFWPSRFGGQTTILVVQGKSMQPTFRSEDLVVARAQDQYARGDIIVFQTKVGGDKGRTALIVHRIIGIDAEGIILTQGDNRTTADGVALTHHDILGRVRWRVPQGGLALWLLSRWWMLAFITGILITVLMWPSQTAEADISEHDPLVKMEPDE